MLRVLTTLLVMMLGQAVMASPYELSYSGRLTESNGSPIKGPVDISIGFFRSETGNDQVSGVTLPALNGVPLNEGVFQIAITLTPAEFHLVFDGSAETWIQVTDIKNNKQYPRQKFSAVPYALKVPVDGQTITFNAQGKLSLDVTGGAPGQFLSKGGSGELVWATAGGSGDLLSTANLSDLTDAAQARNNLQLGSSATANIGTGAGDVAEGNHTHTTATTLAAGFMSAADKGKLDGISAGAGVDTNAKTLCGDGEFLAGDDTTDCKTPAEIVSAGAGVTTADTGTVTSTMILDKTIAAGDIADNTLTALQIGSQAVGSDEIENASIADIDVASNAAIAGGKINPNFGNQNVLTTGSVTAGSFAGDGSGITNVSAVGFVTYATLDQLPASSTNGYLAYVSSNLCTYRYSSSNTRWEVASCSYYPDWRYAGSTQITFRDQNYAARTVSFTLDSSTQNRVYFYGADYSGSTDGVHFFKAEGSLSMDDGAAPARVNGRWQRCGYTFGSAPVCLPYLGMIREKAGGGAFEEYWYRIGNVTRIPATTTDGMGSGSANVPLTAYTSPATSTLQLSSYLHAGSGAITVEKWFSEYGQTNYRYGNISIYDIPAGVNYKTIHINEMTLPQIPGATRGYRYTFQGGAAAAAWTQLLGFEETR